MFFTVFIILYCLVPLEARNKLDISVSWNHMEHKFAINYGNKMSGQDDIVAWGTFSDQINQTGWAFLEVYTNGTYDDLKQAYAAGLVEAHATNNVLSMHWHNTYDGYCKTPLSTFCQQLQSYLDTNLAWMVEQIAQHADSNPYWHQVQLVLEQLSGLIDGFNNESRFPSKYKMDVTGLAMLQIAGDLEDLESALGKTDDHVLGSGSCSALIKLLPGNLDLFVAQDTWNGYSSLLRIQKKYDFQFHETAADSSSIVPGQVMTFSSYPGVLASGDDFYIISSGLVSLETTIGNSNSRLWQYVKPRSAVLEGARNMVANRLAHTVAEWGDIFSRFNSGTYNNQWMVVDYKSFKPGHALPSDGLLLVLEQIPGMIVKRDRTSILAKQTYWPSYNTPYFSEIFNASGCWDNVHKYGDWFTYDHTPRANIFRRDHASVKDLSSMTKLMRYNDYTHDPLSVCACTPPYSAENAISSRSDLNPANGTYPFAALGHRAHGGTDMKLTSSSMAAKLQFIAVSSPTYDNVPPFRWSTADFASTTPHLGQPDLFNFKPLTHQWNERPKSA